MRAVILRGGGDKGSYQIGYNTPYGIPVGSVNSAYLAQYPYGVLKPKEILAEDSLSFNPEDIKRTIKLG